MVIAPFMPIVAQAQCDNEPQSPGDFFWIQPILLMPRRTDSAFMPVPEINRRQVDFDRRAKQDAARTDGA